jgi:hypothetical protein
MSLPGGVLSWASAILGAEVTVLRGLRDGGSPWLLRAGDQQVVLRVARAQWVTETATEVAAMARAARVAGDVLPVAELLGYDLAERTGYGLVLTSRVPGTSVIQREPDPARLRSLGAAAARISSVVTAAVPELPVRSRPIEAEDRLLGRRRRAGLPAGHGMVPAVDGPSGPSRPDPRGPARTPRRLPRRRPERPVSKRQGWLLLCRGSSSLAPLVPWRGEVPGQEGQGPGDGV